MRTTVDIPDNIYRRLKVKAAQDDTSVKTLLLRGAESVLQEPLSGANPVSHREFPVIRSRAFSGTLWSEKFRSVWLFLDRKATRPMRFGLYHSRKCSKRPGSLKLTNEQIDEILYGS